jgi:hypothetical protein
MSLYCLKHKFTNKKCKCAVSRLISVTDNMIPVALIADSLGLQVASAFCLTETHKKFTSVQAELYFKCTYPEELLQDLPNTWYWTDYITLEHKVLCSCLSYEAEYVDTGAMSLDEFVDGVINSLVGYLETFEKGGLMSVLTLLES